MERSKRRGGSSPQPIVLGPIRRAAYSAPAGPAEAAGPASAECAALMGAVRHRQSFSPHTFGTWKSAGFGRALGGTASFR